MLAQTLVTGDKFRTEDLALLPVGTAVKMLGSSGWWEITELPQVETLSERDKLAMELRDVWFKARGINFTPSDSPSDTWRAVADYVLANFPSAETAVAEVAYEDATGEPVEFPERVTDCDGDLWKLTSPGHYSWVSAIRSEINLNNVSLADLLVNHGPISAV